MSNILLVDDNGNVLVTLAIALRRRGHQVTIALDGHSALQELHKRSFDVLISDVRMPGMNGVELVAQARALPNPPRTILTSAYPSVEGRESLAEAFLRKPIDTDQLDALLHSKPDQPEQRPHS